MDIFNKMGEELANAGMEIAKVTMEMTDNAKLHATITTEEAKIREQYKIIGEMYYTQCKNPESERDFTDDYEEAFDRIDISKWKIGEAKEELAKKKGSIICPSCGARVQREAVFCSKCGTKM